MYWLNSKFQIKPTRVGDKILMELFPEQRYTKNIMEQLNLVHWYLRIHSLAHIHLLADGSRVDADLIILQYQWFSTCTAFSWEQSTPSDFETWNNEINDITSPSLKYPSLLGKYLQELHLQYHWFSSEDESLIFHLPKQPQPQIF